MYYCDEPSYVAAPRPFGKSGRLAGELGEQICIVDPSHGTLLLKDRPRGLGPFSGMYAHGLLRQCF